MDGIITSVISGLRLAGFQVRRARPGVRMPKVTACCEMVGLRGLTVRPGGAAEAELFIQVFSPAAQGAQACEQEAAAVAAAVAGGLGTIPACTCLGSECVYDGTGDFFTLRLTMTLPVYLEEGGAMPGQPAVIFSNGVQVAVVSKWTATAQQTVIPLYAFGENAPVGVSAGEMQYILTLEGILPVSEQVGLALLKQFSLVTQQKSGTVTYDGCTWRKFQQVETEHGTVIQAEAMAVSRAEE